MESERGRQEKRGLKRTGLAVLPILVLGLTIAFLVSPQSALFTRGVALPDVDFGRVEFHEGLIIAHVTNTGPNEVRIVQADINDRIVPAGVEPSGVLPRFAGARVVIPFSWNEAQPYEIGITTSDGTRFSKAVPAAAQASAPNASELGLFALLGAFAGVIPVLAGLLWYPFLNGQSRRRQTFFLALTLGLLLFLAADSLIEASELAAKALSGAFQGQLLVVLGTVLSFLVLTLVSNAMAASAKANRLRGPMGVALMVSIGIGLHNLGEGLAIGGAMVAGELGLGAFLVIGFALHNSTEGLAIIAPLSGQRPKTRYLAMLGLLAGLPIIPGAWAGAFFSSPLESVIFLSVGAGAVLQVVWSIVKHSRETHEMRLSSGHSVAGFSAGMLVMYLTSLLV